MFFPIFDIFCSMASVNRHYTHSMFENPTLFSRITYLSWISCIMVRLLTSIRSTLWCVTSRGTEWYTMKIIASFASASWIHSLDRYMHTYVPSSCCGFYYSLLSRLPFHVHLYVVGIHEFHVKWYVLQRSNY